MSFIFVSESHSYSFISLNFLSFSQGEFSRKQNDTGSPQAKCHFHKLYIFLGTSKMFSLELYIFAQCQEGELDEPPWQPNDFLGSKSCPKVTINRRDCRLKLPK